VVSDAERNNVSSRLNEAFAAGTIDADDYQDRLDRLFAAQRLGDLVPVVDGLPPLPTHQPPAIVASTGGRPGELTPARSGNKLTVAIVGTLATVLLLIAILLIVAV
jgi:hypothetical protein